ncbi:hypothetical protein D3C73_1198820 [compost metagenome]
MADIQLIHIDTVCHNARCIFLGRTMHHQQPRQIVRYNAVWLAIYKLDHMLCFATNIGQAVRIKTVWGKHHILMHKL